MSAECREGESKERAGPEGRPGVLAFARGPLEGAVPRETAQRPPVPRPGTFSRGENGELPRGLSGPLETQIRLDSLRRFFPAV